jgi:hypothetical protein
MTDNAMVLRSAFWSGDISYRKWRGIIRKGPEKHMRIYLQSFLHLPIDWLRKEIGDDRFISIWPDVRKGYSFDSPYEMTALDAWDVIWGVLAAGDSQYPVSSEVARLPKMRREILKTIVCNPGVSIYDVAKKTNRDYSRVFKDVHQLAEMGEIEIRLDPNSRRKAKQLLPAKSINAKLSA